MNTRQVYEDIRRGFGKFLCSELDKEGWTDLVLNADGTIWVERKGAMDLIYSYNQDPFTPKRIDFQGIVGSAYTLSSYTHNHLKEENPSFSAVIPISGIRVNFKIPPIVDRITACFRKPSQKVFLPEELIACGTMSESEKAFLTDCIHSHSNIVMAGSTGSGKTTITNSLLTLLPKTDRPFIIEDIRELICKNANQEHVIITPDYPYVRAVEDALRSRPDRIIVGECLKGDQTLALLSAWNTGHSGGITTIHATDAHHVLKRLDQLCSQVSVSSQMEMIRDTVNVVVFMKRAPDGRRYIKEIYDVLNDKYISKKE